MAPIIKTEDLTVEQMRQYKGIKLPVEMNKIINVNTYYRIIDNKFKFGPQNRSLVKLAEAFDIPLDILKKQIENQYKSGSLNKKK